jgi:hypothetical protein
MRGHGSTGHHLCSGAVPMPKWYGLQGLIIIITCAAAVCRVCSCSYCVVLHHMNSCYDLTVDGHARFGAMTMRNV